MRHPQACQRWPPGFRIIDDLLGAPSRGQICLVIKLPPWLGPGPIHAQWAGAEDFRGRDGLTFPKLAGQKGGRACLSGGGSYMRHNAEVLGVGAVKGVGW